MASNMALLFEKHHLALQYLVPNLLKLYVDIEFTGSHTQVFLFSFCDPLSVQGY
jgi:ubiquitin conjugation factor E4 B